MHDTILTELLCTDRDVPDLTSGDIEYMRGEEKGVEAFKEGVAR